MKIIGVTIGTGGQFPAMAELAAKRFEAATGLECRLLKPSDYFPRAGKLESMLARYKTFEAFPDADAVVYFDADLAFVRKWNPVELFAAESRLMMVVDGHWDGLEAEARKLGMPLTDYHNAGFHLANREHHAELFHRFLKWFNEIPRMEYGDQSAFNLFLQMTGTPVADLPATYNFFAHEWPNAKEQIDPMGVIGWHCAANEKPLFLEIASLGVRECFKPDPVPDGLCNRRFWYNYGGASDRIMVLSPDGRIVHGWGGYEMFWWMKNGDLLFSNHKRKTCSFVRVGDGWAGHWLVDSLPACTLKPVLLP